MAKKKHYVKSKYFPIGVEKVRKNAKAAWVAKEDVNGWSLGLSVDGLYDKKTRWLRGLRIATREEVERLLGSAIVFVHLKNSTTIPETLTASKKNIKKQKLGRSTR